MKQTQTVRHFVRSLPDRVRGWLLSLRSRPGLAPSLDRLRRLRPGRKGGNAALGALLAGAAALWILTGDDPPPPPPAEPAAPALSAPPEVGTIHSTAEELVYALPLRGYTEASRRVDIRAETGGLVIGSGVPKGTVVTKGDALCRIAPGERPALLAQTKARITQAEAEALSARTLAAEGYGAETLATAADASLAAARAEVERMELDITRTVIAAPFDGILETDSAEPGSLLQPGALCATLLDLDPARIVGFAPERVIDSFTVGTPARATLATGHQVAGNISFVARSAESRTRTFRIEITVPNPDGRVRDGLGAEILVAVRHPGAHRVPQSALTLSSEGDIGLRTVVEGRARFAAVQLLRDDSNGVWVSGLPTHTEVIVVGQEFVTDGTEVTARPAPDLSRP